MTPTEITPVSVLFDLAKRQCGVSHKELATMLLSGRPLSDGRSPQSRVDDRTWVSRFIVHAPGGTLTDRYFCDYTVGALRLAARMKSRSKRALSGEAILDIVCGEAGRAMDDALRAHGQNPTLYRNMLERIACEGSLSADERAEVALVLLVTAACTADVRRAVAEARDFADTAHGGGLVTPPPTLVAASPDAGLTAADEPPRWLGLLRVMNGLVAGAPQWMEPTATGSEIGALALTEGAANEVGPDVSGAHARIWCDETGAWWVEGLDSRHGTVLVSGVSGEETVVEPPRGQREGWQPAPIPLAVGDQLRLAASTTFLVIEGYPC